MGEETMTDLIEQVTQPELYTVEQLAEKQGLSTAGMRKRIQKLGLEPVIPAEDVFGVGRIAAKYDAQALSKIQQQQQQSVLEEKKKQAARKVAEGMDLVGQKAFIQTAYESLELHDKVQFMLESIQATLQAMDDEKERVESEREALKIRLAEDENWYSTIRMMKAMNLPKEDSWRPLKKYSLEHDVPIQKVFDKNYGEVNAYHRNVWFAVYGYDPES